MYSVGSLAIVMKSRVKRPEVDHLSNEPTILVSVGQLQEERVSQDSSAASDLRRPPDAGIDDLTSRISSYSSRTESSASRL